MRLLQVAEKAYYRDRSYAAWKNGQYTYAAFNTVMSNAFAKKGTKQIEYPQWEDPYEETCKPKITKENIEDEFRKQQIMQQDWLFKR